MDFEHDYAFGVPSINDVECQVYPDKYGQELPLGTVTNKQALKFEKPTSVGGVLCYVKDLS